MKLHLTYSVEKTSVKVEGEAVEIKPFQIIVSVSVSIPGDSEWDPRTPKLPTILDVGNNHNFSLTEEHLVRWAGLQPTSLDLVKTMRESGKRVPLRSAGLWLHFDEEPFNLDVNEGIAVYDGDWPRLPILGLRALTNSKLQTFIYGDTKQVLIRTPPPWYWPF